MAIHRTYLVQMPSNASAFPYLDIFVQGNVGTPTAPVAIGGATTPPSGWQIVNGDPGDGIICEIRGRVLCFEHLASAGAAGGFVPRLRLGWKTAIECLSSTECLVAPAILYSQSFAGTVPAPWNNSVIADPSYGPSMRLINSADIQGGVFAIHLDIFEQKDEDRDPTGSV